MPVSHVLVRVRAVRASQKLDAHQRHMSVGRLDARLSDVGSKLQALPFQRFALVSDEKRVVSMKNKEIFSLADGQTLTVRPLYYEDHKVGMSLKWRDKEGVDILDTRMHFDPGESMLAGTDSLRGPDEGFILAIRVEEAP